MMISIGGYIFDHSFGFQASAAAVGKGSNVAAIFFPYKLAMPEIGDEWDPWFPWDWYFYLLSYQKKSAKCVLVFQSYLVKMLLGVIFWIFLGGSLVVVVVVFGHPFRPPEKVFKGPPKIIASQRVLKDSGKPGLVKQRIALVFQNPPNTL